MPATIVISEHDERDDTEYGTEGHQELFAVMSGHAIFTVGGQELDAPAGTLVFVRDPALPRSARATWTARRSWRWRASGRTLRRVALGAGDGLKGRSARCQVARRTRPYGVCMTAFLTGRRTLRSLVLVLAISVVAGVLASQAFAGATKFKNCTAVHKKYKHGIAKSTKAANRANGLTGKPKISLSLYTANKGKDRDHDGVACEK